MVLTITLLELIEGLFSVFIVIITTSIGILIYLKYKKFKSKEFLYCGIGFIGVYSPIWPSALSFLILIITQNEAFAITNICLWMGMWTIPSIFFLLMWVLGIFELLPSEKKKLIILIITSIGIIFESLIIYYIATQQCDKLGSLDGIFDSSYRLPVLLWALFITFIASITGVLIGINAIKAGKRDLKIKGLLLLYSFITYPIATIIDGGMTLDTVGVMIIRTIEVSITITFYMGMFLPNFMRNILKIED